MCGVIGKLCGAFLPLWQDQGAPTLDNARGAHPLLWIGMKGREREGPPPLLSNETLRGCQVLVPYLPALYNMRRPLRLPYLTGAPHVLAKKD